MREGGGENYVKNPQYLYIFLGPSCKEDDNLMSYLLQVCILTSVMLYRIHILFWYISHDKVISLS